MEIIRNPITKQDLIDRYMTCYPEIAKAVVDVERGIMAVDAEWHAENGKIYDELTALDPAGYRALHPEEAPATQTSK